MSLDCGREPTQTHGERPHPIPAGDRGGPSCCEATLLTTALYDMRHWGLMQEPLVQTDFFLSGTQAI